MYTDFQLWSYQGKQVKVYTSNDGEITGTCCGIIPSYDNEPEVTSFIIQNAKGLIDISLPEIEKIEMIE